MSALRDAVEALLSNEEHATSGGMRSYAVGSPTWELWESVRQALALLDAEPVGWLEVKDRYEGPYEFHGSKLLDSGKHNLYTAPQPAITKATGETP